METHLLYWLYKCWFWRMNIWLMQSECSDEEAVSRRRAASCPGVGRVPTQRRAFYCTHSSALLSPLQCSPLLYYCSPALWFLAHHLSSHLSYQFSICFAVRFAFPATLTVSQTLLCSQHVGGSTETPVWMGRELCTVGLDDCVWLNERSRFCIWLHVRHSLGRLWRDVGD